MCPLAIGGHVDHVLAKHCGGLLEADNVCVLYYRDFLYDRAWGGDFDHLALEHFSVSLSRQELDRKIIAFSEYKSQIPELFGTHAEMHAYFEGNGKSESIFLPRGRHSAQTQSLRTALELRAKT
jgi:hypothetical protein